MSKRKLDGAAFMAASLVAAAALAAPAREPVTVEDLARFASFGDPKTLQWDEEVASRDAGIFSPDGSRVAVLVRHGNVERGTNDGTLLIYQTRDLLRGGRPLEIAQFSSARNSQPIAFIRWLADDETLLFAATRGEELPQIYRVNVRTRLMEQLTRESTELVQYDIDPAGRKLVTLSEPPARPPAQDPVCRRRGCRVTEDWHYYAEQGIDRGSAPLTVHDLRSRQISRIANPEMADDTVKRCRALLGSISPDGRFALRLCELREWPLWWNEYTAGWSTASLQWSLQKKIEGSAIRLTLVDLQQGKSRALSDAPAMAPAAVWIDDGRRLVIAGALESLAGTQDTERRQRARAFAIQIFDLETGKLERIDRLGPEVTDVIAATWDAAAQTLAVRLQNVTLQEPRGYRIRELPAAYYQRVASRWLKVAPPRVPQVAGHSVSVQLAIEQSLNDPPVLVAKDVRGHQKRRVLDPNPWLSERALGHVAAIEWQSTDHRLWRGGLYYPQNYQPVHRYPLVIQTHGFFSEQFSMDGRARNFAGRALAAQDIFVLQVAENEGEFAATARELPVVRAGYEGAIDHLDRLGLIDRTRVGVQGWSRTGPQLGHLMTHSSYPIAAGAFTDSGDFSIWWYLLAGAPAQEFDSMFGGPFFGAGMKRWIETSAGLNLDRLRTPMLMWEAHGATGLWDWYAGLRRLGKPVEYWTLPDGEHDVYQVSQRLHTNQLLVDWFRFWLKGEERTQSRASESSDELADQYARWRGLRKQQEEALRKPRPPLLEWQAKPLVDPR